MEVKQEMAAVLVASDKGTTLVVAPSPLWTDALVASWLCMAVNGLISTASLMMGVGAVKDDAQAMVLCGIAWLVSGAIRIDTGELVYSQRDIEIAHMKMEMKTRREAAGREGKLRSAVQAAVAPVVSFTLGAVVPLMAACMIREYRSRLVAVAAATSLALVAFGCIGVYWEQRRW